MGEVNNVGIEEEHDAFRHVRRYGVMMELSAVGRDCAVKKLSAVSGLGLVHNTFVMYVWHAC